MPLQLSVVLGGVKVAEHCAVIVGSVGIVGWSDIGFYNDELRRCSSDEVGTSEGPDHQMRPKGR
jgi:hypothetical protein